MISPEALRRYPYFSTIREESLRQVAMFTEDESVAAGEQLFAEGDTADRLYVVVEGEFDLQYTLGSGELRTVDTIVPGELLMWSSLVEPYKATASAVARGPAKLLSIDAPKLRTLCEDDHDLGYRMLLSLTRLLSSRLEGARVQLATID